MERLNLTTETLALKDGFPKAEWYDLRRIARESVFDFDNVVKVTHQVNCWYNMHCTMNLYVKDGVALREEQPHTYPARNDPECPDFNPKGCNKGCVGVHRTYDACRLLHPMKRVGARGEGKWKRVTWDEALDDITDKFMDIMVKDGPRAIHLEPGSQPGSEYNGLATNYWGMRGFGRPGTNIEIGDDHQGALEVTGKTFFTDSADDLFYTDLLCIWGGNPAYTAQTFYHYFLEARYRGAKVVVISVDYNATAPIADLWLSIKPGTDAALALSMVQVIMEEGLQKEEFILEQTDLPLLVRMDNHKFLRESNVKKDGRDYVFYFWDKATNKITEAPFQTLKLEGAKPALEGEWEVQTLKGKVKVRPVMSLFKEKLNREYTPEQASQITGISSEIIRQFAREFAKANRVINMSQSNFCKYYHGNIMERAMIYLWAITGHMGRRGDNYAAFAAGMSVDKVIGAIMPARFGDVAKRLVNHPKYPDWKARGFDDERVAHEAMMDGAENSFVSTGLYHYFHSGILDMNEKYNNWDPHLKRPLAEYVKQGIADGRKVNFGRDRKPKALITNGGDPLRRIRHNQGLVETLFPKLDLIVVRDIRWTATSLYADYVLPAASWYEQEGAFPASMIYTPWLTFMGKGVEPPCEVKNDWWWWTTFFTKLSEKARARGIKTVTDPQLPGVDLRVDDIDTQWTGGGQYGPDDQQVALRDSWGTATNVAEIVEGGYDEFARKGFGMLTTTGPAPITRENGGELTMGDPFVPNTDHVIHKKPWPTLTGRMHFYIDHDWYLELDEEFAWHKDSVKSGGDYPIQMTGGHSRWSVHSIHADDAILLKLQRGEPLMLMAAKDAEARGIKDGDRVEVFNDVGDFQIMVGVSSLMRPGQAAVYHHWVNFQHKDWKQYQQVAGTPFNPTEFAPAGSDYPNLRQYEESGSPGMSDRDTRIEIRKIG